nr:hypothetical protein [Tanacetum cinerariifolium]
MFLWMQHLQMNPLLRMNEVTKNSVRHVMLEFLMKHLVAPNNEFPGKLMQEMYIGGFKYIGATATDCKNERRDM